MTTHRPLISIILLTTVGCSDSAQFNNAAGARVIEAERITSTESSVDPSADASSSTGTDVTVIDPETGLPVSGGTPGEGGGGGGGTTNPDGSIATGGGAGGAGGAGGTGSGGPTAGGSGTGTGPSAETIASNVATLKAACDSGLKKQIKQSVRFGEVQKCTWGANGNLNPLDLHVQAIEGQKATIDLPANAKLCELGIGSAATTIQYDDFMLITLNNQVLLASNKELLADLQPDQVQAYAWDFSRVRGKAINWDAAPYCLGDSSTCNIPVTDVQGSFAFNIDPESLGKLAANSVNKTRLDFALYATGDNDTRDCWHTAFTLDFTLNYVE